ncbi:MULTISPECIES: peptidase S41 [unclassified Ruegeria]|uniref:peptidase S41 n=1 Tax=unclassified Ruegeria TaxID=2625375 RepID=UPI001491C498|nr:MULTISPECIES: peptidase S41 [unclassified Ruegeria]NOD47067.1 peptidase S41 [Ruegeria sp. HKCCD5849]NOD51390.1 peptidase S41 [Ruegeria sp. HKCCD5851]NOD68209.1 peptidase S41 [Ruegeria sp. HKCCD7303]
MPLTQDLKLILETVLPTDPSFRRVNEAEVDSYINDCRRCALAGSIDAFLLSAMRLLALPNNGHTRLIPNDAISVLPLRFVSIGRSVQVIAAASGETALRGELIAVNGAALSQIEAAAEKFLAGTSQRKRVVGPLLLAWPYALARLGFSAKDATTEYRVRNKNGQITKLKMANRNTVPASSLYPRNEHGKTDPAWEPETFVAIKGWQGLGLSMQLPSFFDPGETALPKAISGAADRVRACSNKTLLIDVRGNTGGNFLMAMPLIEAISQSAIEQVVVLVDKFTFSAAIVFVAILKHRLGHRLKLIGEEMGDGLMFFAEGGLLNLPTSGAVVRYSSAFHDWEGGTSGETTPPEIARQIVPAGALNLDREWVEGPIGEDAQGAFYQRVLKSMSD